MDCEIGRGTRGRVRRRLGLGEGDIGLREGEG